MVTCPFCNKCFGETGRIIEEQIKEHQAKVNNAKITGLSQHLNESRHTPNWKEVEIQGKENNIIKQKFKESVAILQEKKDNILNKRRKEKF